MKRAHQLVAALIEAQDPDELNPQDYLDKLPARITARWVFTDQELSTPQLCRAEDEFFAFPTLDGGENGVIVYRDGRVTNRFADGTAGVPDEIYQAAGDCTTLISSENQMADNWQDVYTDEDGNFVDWTGRPE